MKQKITGIVKRITDNWLAVAVNGTNPTIENLLKYNEYTRSLSVGDYFELEVESVCSSKNPKQIKWFHIATSENKKSRWVTIGVGVSNMIFQPIINNVIVKNGRAYQIKKCRKRDNGWEMDYGCNEWWELKCTDITDTILGKRAIKETRNNL